MNVMLAYGPQGRSEMGLGRLTGIKVAIRRHSGSNRFLGLAGSQRAPSQEEEADHGRLPCHSIYNNTWAAFTSDKGTLVGRGPRVFCTKRYFHFLLFSSYFLHGKS